jgi:hypothetical protein
LVKRQGAHRAGSRHGFARNTDDAPRSGAGDTTMWAVGWIPNAKRCALWRCRGGRRTPCISCGSDTGLSRCADAVTHARNRARTRSVPSLRTRARLVPQRRPPSLKPPPPAAALRHGRHGLRIRACGAAEPNRSAGCRRGRVASATALAALLHWVVGPIHFPSLAGTWHEGTRRPSVLRRVKNQIAARVRVSTRGAAASSAAPTARPGASATGKHAK